MFDAYKSVVEMESKDPLKENGIVNRQRRIHLEIVDSQLGYSRPNLD